MDLPAKNNFDFLRILFASFVIITHSYPITGLPEIDWVAQYTGSKLSFSFLGLRGFFIISGYLIFHSLQRSKTLVDYFWNRCLRLFPGLAVALLVTILLGIFVYEGLPGTYYRSPALNSYFIHNFLLFDIRFGIPGIFERNPLPVVINGAIWTLAYEFTFYILLGALFFVRNKPGLIRALLIMALTGGITIWILFLPIIKDYGYYLSAQFLLDFGIYFVAGAVLASMQIEKWREKTSNILLACCLVVFLFTALFSLHPDWLGFLLLPFIILLFGLKSTPILRDINTKTGDLSYGIYIYGFPVQQTLTHFFHPGHIALMFYSIIIAAILGFLSWHIVEKRALQWKRFQPGLKLSRVIKRNKQAAST